MSLNQNCKMENENSCFPETDSSNSTIISLRRASPKKQDIKDVVKFNILPLLPAKALIRFRSVSKDWDWWITNPLFVFHQSYSFRKLSGFLCQFDDSGCVFLSLDHLAYGVPTPPLRILPEHATITSSSGGLLLCQGQNGMNTYFICNPATEEWKELPAPEMYHGESATVLAFEPSVRNMHSHYEVICAVRLFDQNIVGFEVYSSATKSWRQSKATCVEFGYSSFAGTGFYMNGVAYWMMSTREVLVYDVEEERYEIISLPCECPDDGVLTHMQRELCYIGIYNSSGNKYLIKIYGGMFLELKHTIEVHLDSDYSGEIVEYRVLPCYREGEVMVLVGSMIYSCSLSDGRTELISREGVGSFWGSGAPSYLPYVNSLVTVV